MRGESNKALTVVGIAAFLIAVTGVAWMAIATLSREISPRARKMAAADRIINYVATHERGPRFQLSGNEKVLKLITHAIMAAVPQYDPERVVGFGVRIRLHDGDPDKPDLWSTDLYADARQSKADFVEGTFMLENAFSLDGNDEIADDRELVVFLPDDYPPNVFMDLRVIGDADRVLLRVYDRQERTPFRREVIARSLDVGESSEEERSSTYLPWQFVPRNEQLNRLRFVYHRMSALGSSGVDYETESMYFTGFRLPTGSLQNRGSFLINKDRAAALNLLGPGPINLRLAAPDRTVAGSGAVNRISVERVGPGQVDPPRELAAPLDRVTETPLEFPDGVSTMVLRNHGPFPILVTVLEGAALGFGLPPAPRLDDRGGPPVRRHLLPDERDIQTHLMGPGVEPVTVKLDARGELFSRVLRADVRFPFAGDFQAAPLSGTVAVEFLDDAQRSLARYQRPLSAPASEFERMEKVTIVKTDSQLSFRPLLVPMGISDAVNFRVVSPPGAVAVRVSCDVSATVNLFSYLAAEDVHELPYRDVELVGLRWRYAPLERRRWLPIQPDNRAELMVAGHVASVFAQVRLVPDDAVVPPSGRPTTSIEPRGAPERQEILEALTGSRRQALAQWRPSLLAASRLGAISRVNISDRAAARTTLHYRALPEDLGARLSLWVDGKPLGSVNVDRSRGFFRLPRLHSGIREITVTGARPDAAAFSRGFALFLDQPPADDAEIFAVRTVYALGADGLRLSLDRRSDEDVVINAIVYDRGRGPDPAHRVRAVIDGGDPRRTSAPTSHLTIADKTSVLPAANHFHAAAFLDRAGQAGYPRVVPIFIGQDLVAHHHEVTLAALDGQRYWARFFVTRRKISSEERALQWGLTEELGFERAETDARNVEEDGAP